MTFDICLSIQKSFRDHHLLRPEPALVRPPKRLLMNWDLCLRRNKRCSPRSSDKTKQGLSRGTHPLPSHHYPITITIAIIPNWEKHTLVMETTPNWPFILRLPDKDSSVVPGICCYLRRGWICTVV